jgi:hypothetical protein
MMHILANRRGLVEKSSLIKHTTSTKTKKGDNYSQQPSIEQRSASVIDSQTLLKDVNQMLNILNISNQINNFKIWKIICEWDFRRLIK